MVAAMARGASGGLLALLAAALLPSLADAWSRDGHERIARIAQDMLKGKRKDQIRTMIHGDLIELAGWEQTMTSKFAETDTLHWHRQQPEWTCAGLRKARPGELQHLGDKAGHIACDGHGAESGSLFCALAYFFEHFAHDALLSEFPKPKEPISTPKKLPALAKLTSVEHAPSHYLRWLVVLIGDLHQPLHWLRENDYGKKLKVVYQEQEYTLLSFWEDYIPRRLAPVPSLTQLQKEYEHLQPAWMDKQPTELFHIWAEEVAEVLCNQVYTAMETNHADGSRTIATPFKLEEELFQKWLKIAQTFTTLGGQRLGFVLNEILEHRRHKVAHHEGRGRHHRKRSWKRNLAINLGIAAVLVPGLLFLFQWHFSTGALGLWKLSLGGPGGIGSALASATRGREHLKS